MSEHTAVVDRYFSFWNEADPERRREIAPQVFTDDLSYVGPQITAGNRREIEEVARQVTSQMPGVRLRLLGDVDAHHDRLRYRWEIITPDADCDGETRFAAGTDIAELTEDGLIRAITVFLDQAPDFADAPHHP